MKNLSMIRSRRNLFKLAATSLITVSAGLSTGCDFFKAEKLTTQQRLIQSLHHLERAQEIGVAFRSLDSVPNFNSLEHLTEELLLWLDLDSKKIQKLSDKTLIKRLSQQIRDDFINEDIVIIDKWMFSKTEAMLCALADFQHQLENNKELQS